MYTIRCYRTGLLFVAVTLCLASCSTQEPTAPCVGTVWSCDELTPGGWCQQQEGCGIGRVCQIDPSSCSAFEESGCGQASGCGWTTDCAGEAARCHVFLDANLCNIQIGCVWVNADRQCYGQRVYCNHLSVSECTTQVGCYRSGECAVTSTCHELDEQSCSASANCAWGDGCTGQAAPCGDFDDKDSCEYQAGCSWP